MSVNKWTIHLTFVDEITDCAAKVDWYTGNEMRIRIGRNQTTIDMMTCVIHEVSHMIMYLWKIKMKGYIEERFCLKMERLWKEEFNKIYKKQVRRHR